MANQTLLDIDPDSPLAPNTPPPLFESEDSECIPATPPAKRRKRSSKHVMYSFSEDSDVAGSDKEGHRNDVVEDSADIDRSPVWQRQSPYLQYRNFHKDDSRFRNTFASPSSIRSSSSGGSSDPSPSSSLRSSSSHDESVLEILREIRKENQKLRDDFKKLSEQMGEGNSGRKGKSRKLCVPPEVKNTLHKVYRSFGTEKPELQWKMMEEFTSDHNQDVSSQLVREVKSVHPETPSSIIHGATKTYFVSLSGVSKMKSSGVYSAKCVQQRRRNRILRKLNLRKTTMVKSTTLSEESKRKWKPVFISELMSSEESDDSEDGNASFTVRPLLWRSDKVSNFLSKLDEKKFNSCTQRSKRMSLKRKVGLPSDRPPPAGLPDWIVNTNH